MFIDKIEETMFLVSASCLYLFYNQYLVVYFVRLNQLVVQSEVTVNLQNLSGKFITVNLVYLSIRISLSEIKKLPNVLNFNMEDRSCQSQRFVAVFPIRNTVDM